MLWVWPLVLRGGALVGVGLELASRRGGAGLAFQDAVGWSVLLQLEIHFLNSSPPRSK